MSEKLNEAQLRFLFREMMTEILDEHYYDAMRQLYWYTGWMIIGFGDVVKIDRKDGRFAPWWKEPYVEISEEEFRSLVGLEKADEE